MPRINIVHFSDWHGVWDIKPLPPADLYICTGDMLPTFTPANQQLDVTKETYEQAKYVRARSGDFRSLILSNPRSPLVVVRGDKDFVHLSKLFGESNTFEIGKEVTEFTLQVKGIGLKVAGFRGVSKMFRGDTDSHVVHSDGRLPATFLTLSKQLPLDADILVTHTPPLGSLDKMNLSPLVVARVGVQGLHEYFQQRKHTPKKLKLHCFGHAHDSFCAIPLGSGKEKLLLSNAAGGYGGYLLEDDEITMRCVTKLPYLV